MSRDDVEERVRTYFDGDAGTGSLRHLRLLALRRRLDEESIEEISELLNSTTQLLIVKALVWQILRYEDSNLVQILPKITTSLDWVLAVNIDKPPLTKSEMPHADTTNFTSHDKASSYAQLLDSLKSLVHDSRFWPTNTANAASLLWHLFHSLPAPSNRVNWSGFYVVDPADSTRLLLGPFMGKVACQIIKIGKGVCGTAAERRKTVLVDDVEAFPGHIACDGDSKSEIVVPVLVGDKCVAIIDIDCAELNGFDEDDQRGLEAIAEVLAKSCDW